MRPVAPIQNGAAATHRLCAAPILRRRVMVLP